MSNSNRASSLEFFLMRRRPIGYNYVSSQICGEPGSAPNYLVYDSFVSRGYPAAMFVPLLVAISKLSDVDGFTLHATHSDTTFVSTGQRRFNEQHYIRSISHTLARQNVDPTH